MVECLFTNYLGFNVDEVMYDELMTLNSIRFSPNLGSYLLFFLTLPQINLTTLVLPVFSLSLKFYAKTKEKILNYSVFYYFVKYLLHIAHIFFQELGTLFMLPLNIHFNKCVNRQAFTYDASVIVPGYSGHVL